MYYITPRLLIIDANNDTEFFQIYDEVIKIIPDTTFNKKWYRSSRRTFCGNHFGIRKYVIPFRQTTLKSF